MDIEATKLELMQLLLQTQEEKVLVRLREVFQEQTPDWWSNLSPQEKRKINKGIEQGDKGDHIDNSEIRRKFEKWH